MYLIRLPRMGQTMESGTILTWHFAQGDEFHEGDNLYEVETDKSVTEVEAKQDGVVARIITPTDKNVPVGALLVVAAKVGEAFDDNQIDDFLAADGVSAEKSAAEESGAEDASVEGAGGGDVPSAPEPATEQRPADSSAPATDGPVRAVPKARALAKRLGVDLRSVRGSGEGGVIRVGDVEGAGGSVRHVGAPRVAERIPVRGVAKAMADSMTRSWTEVPQFVQQVSLNATALQARLERLRYEGVAVTYTDLLIAAVAAAAREVPDVNATFTAEEIIRYADVNVSFAVAADRGLLVPVVRQADQLSISEVAAATRALAERARGGKLTTEDLSDGTITVSNLGAYGVETGFPIVNAPQSAIVFVGALADRAVVENGQLVVRPMLNLAIGYDHRVLDGMAAAKFTSALKTRLEAGG